MKKYLFSVIAIVSLGTIALADTQTKIVGTGVNDASVGDIAWGSPGNITADDAANAATARIQNAQTSQRLRGTMSGNVFTIPAGATIDSIRVEIEISDIEAADEGSDLEVKLIKGGTVSGNDQSKGATILTSVTIRTYAPLDNWGVTLTAADVNATDFGVAYRVKIGSPPGRSEPNVDFIRITVAYTTVVTLSSAANQTFPINDSPTAISTLTVADIGTATITALNDIRIRIPTGFNMIWDTLDLTATIGGSASTKVSGTVSYEDAGKTLVLNVTTDFAASDTITIADLSFTEFTATSPANNLELEVLNDGAISATDDKTIAIRAPTISSAENKIFPVGVPPIGIVLQTVTDDITPTITAANDIRIRIPTGFNMIWDTLDLTATIGGNASTKVSGTVSYEDAGKTLVLNVTTDFAASDIVTIVDLSFADFTNGSPADNLELEVLNDGAISATDDKTVTIKGPLISSAANQTFTVGDPATAISTQTVSEVITQTITAANDIRIRIPTGFNMIWDTLDFTATIGGNASSKVSGTVSYEDAGKTLVLNVTTDFAASDTITIADLSFISFTAASTADNLELEVENNGAISATDDKTITITNLSVSLSNSTFAFGTQPLNTWLAAQNTIITNNGQVAENFVGQLSQFTDGTNNWAINNVANGSDIIRAQFSITSSTGPWTDISAYDSDFTIATNVAVSGTVTCWFRIQTPTATSSLNQHASTLTVTAAAF